MSVENGGKLEILVYSFSFFFNSFKFAFLSACEKLLENNIDLAARAELQGWNWQH